MSDPSTTQNQGGVPYDPANPGQSYPAGYMVGQSTTGATYGGGGGRRMLLPALVLGAVSVAVSVMWLIVARRAVDAGMRANAVPHLERAKKAFDHMRSRTQTQLRVQCQVLVEDPRLKSALGTEGMDEATLVDILNDLRTLSGSSFLAILTPEGKVRAVSGADGLRGMPLGNSQLMTSARNAPSAVAGTWVINGDMIDVGAQAIRFEKETLAFFVAGAPLDKDLMHQVYETSGAGIALILEGKVKASAPSDAPYQAAFEALAGQSGELTGRAFESGGMGFLASITNAMPEAPGQDMPRVAAVRAMDSSNKAFDRLGMMLWIPPAIVFLIACIVPWIGGATRG